MLSREGKQTDRGAVGAEFIGYNRRRREALLLQEFPHQPNCRPSVPAGLNQKIQDFALTVHGTPEIELPPSNYDDHLVQVPAFGRSWPPTLNPPRIGPTEFQDPSSNCLIRDVETTLGKQVLNVPIAQRETAIEPDGMLDDDRWKAVTTVGYLAHPETLKHRPCRSHAVNVTMPSRAIGTATYEARTENRSGTIAENRIVTANTQWQAGDSRALVRERLITPDELMTLGPDHQYVIASPKDMPRDALHLHHARYWRRWDSRNLADPNPFVIRKERAEKANTKRVWPQFKLPFGGKAL